MFYGLFFCNWGSFVIFKDFELILGGGVCIWFFEVVVGMFCYDKKELVEVMEVYIN